LLAAATRTPYSRAGRLGKRQLNEAVRFAQVQKPAPDQVSYHIEIITFFVNHAGNSDDCSAVRTAVEIWQK
jgi:hypothetical protein